MTKLSSAQSTDINTIATFLADNTNPPNPARHPPSETTVYILAGNAILPITERLFHHLSSIISSSSEENLDITPVISGGVGHSTQLLYDAVLSHPRYQDLFKQSDLKGLPESRILEKILYERFAVLVDHIKAGRMKIFVEDKSSNCGENAQFSVEMLDKEGISPKRVIVVQDPTMARRTAASLEAVYQKRQSMSNSLKTPEILTWSPVAPKLTLDDVGDLAWEVDSGVTELEEAYPYTPETLWDFDRYLQLVMGEIPRMRDDVNGYGPKGKGFIAHVDIPTKVEEAYGRLVHILDDTR